MGRPADSRLAPALARELAVREGIKAVVTGEIGTVGDAYLISVELVSPTSGEVLVAQRETADGLRGIIPAIDRLSRRLRERIGESLRRVRAERPLETVTTPSLDALRKYSLAVRLGVGNGDFTGAIPLLEEAVALDTGFAMAYRALGVYRGQIGDRTGLIEALTRAFQHGERLTNREAEETRAAYFDMVTRETDKAIASYRAILEQDPTDRTALVNLALTYAQQHDYATAESLDARAIALDSTNWIPYLNLIYAQVAAGKRSDAESTLARAKAKMPGLPGAEFDEIDLAASGGEYDRALGLARSFQERHQRDPRWGPRARGSLASLAQVRGKLAEAEAYLSEAMAASEAVGDTSGYLDLAIDRAMIDIDGRGRQARGLRQIRRALSKYPMGSLAPSSRPYLGLAQAYAKLRLPARARELVAEYDRVVDSLLRLDVSAAYLRHVVAGEIALAERRPAVAVAEFRQSLVCPTCSLTALARAYDALGQTDSAITTYERYLATPDIGRLSDDAESLARTYRRLGDLYMTRGQRAKAAESYTRFVELWKDCDPDLRGQVGEVRRLLIKLGPTPSG
jgi:tetratricopeptide (TPR) repeat protein